MKAEIKHIYGPDVPAGLKEWVPPNLSDFGLRLQVFIGTTDDDTSDSFDVVVCTPNWLTEKWAEGWFADARLTDRVLSGHGVLLMKEWSYEELRAALEQLVGRIDATTWGNVANRIGRHLDWEYAYRYDEYQDEGRPFP